MTVFTLEPVDVLFFRDGRPMDASLAGHGDAWPLPTVLSAAIHAALHRAGFQSVHRHRLGRNGQIFSENREKEGRQFGSVRCAGPFPVRQDQTWFFPAPQDLLSSFRTPQNNFSLQPAFAPSRQTDWVQTSSLPSPLRFAIANLRPPEKDAFRPQWLSQKDWEAYLQPTASPATDYLQDQDFMDTEATVGIAIDPNTQTTETGRFYSAYYLRLRPGWFLGAMAEAPDKEFQDPQTGTNDLIQALFAHGESEWIVGGQQRLCRVRPISSSDTTPLPLPQGLRTGFPAAELDGRTVWLLKWILLTPAVWPEIPECEKNGTRIQPHPGGWLPHWVDPQTGAVLLKRGDTQRRPGESRTAWRQRVQAMDSFADHARLVAALIPKPIVVTGWSLSKQGEPADSQDSSQPDSPDGGAKATHLAVPAGAVYYFLADSEQAAADLAQALNWHGNSPGTQIQNRRSGIFGEKGFGLGVCSGWQFWEDVVKRSSS